MDSHRRPAESPSAHQPVLAVPPALDLAGWVRRHAAAAEGPRQAEDDAARCNLPAADPDLERRIRRASAYLARLPGAVSGQGGHDRTFRAACVLIKGFNLTADQARPLLTEWNRGCVPAWSAAELEHKLKDAEAAPDARPRGYLAAVERLPAAPYRRIVSLPGRLDDRGPGRGDAPSPSPPRPASTSVRTPLPAPPPAAPPERALPSPCPDGQEANPHRLAALFLEERFGASGEIALRFWREEFHEWDGSAYRRIPTAEMRAELAQFLAREFDRLYRRALAERGSARDRRLPRPIAVTGRLIGDVVQALAGLVLIRAADCPCQPAWIEEIPAGSHRPDEGRDVIARAPWPPSEVLPTRNALVHLPSLVRGGDCSLPPTPRFFNAFALDYDFEPAAREPAAWLAFLRQVWEDDQESIDCLQEWFGYLLTADTRQQKILMMVGPKRSGRGTIARVLKALAGANNVVNPTLGTLARPFGLSSLIDKPVAVFPDARLSSRPDNAAIVECLLSISGEDDQTVDRKHMPAWTGRLPTRFVLISNELPRLRDASGALTSRLIILRFTRSFYGREDTGLFDRLTRELPGILRWAIDGWDRLRCRGRFIQPRSAGDLVAVMDELASPISAFLEDRCVLDPRDSVPVAALYEAWRSWCQEHGRDAVGDEQSFGRDLHAAIPGLTKSRHRKDSIRIPHYNGIRLRTPMDPEPDPGPDSPERGAPAPGRRPPF